MNKQEIVQQAENKAIEILKREIPKANPLFSHSVRCGFILKQMDLGPNTVMAGILHHVPTEKLENEVKTIVKKVYQIKELSEPKKAPKLRPIKQWQKMFLSEQGENIRKMFFAVAQDLRPIFVTLAGKLDEMQNLVKNYAKDEQIKKSLIAFEILAPLAYGLGMGDIKGQFEDLAFPYVYEKEYKWLQNKMREEYKEREKYLDNVKTLTQNLLQKEKIPFLDINARAKHLFSLYQKLLRHDMALDKIYDLIALRIICPDIATCYKTLGIIHNKWKPMPGRVKDYIATAKQNGYRSLHTTVFCEKQKPVEFQIKTKEMHKEAEYGAAAHLSYEKNISAKKYSHRFFWMEQMRKWRADAVDSKKISEYVKSELFKDKVFVMTPNKEVIGLNKDSTPVDFAYAIHTEVGDHCEGAKINNKMAGLNQKLKTGDTVEILLNKNKTPSLDWLRFVKTHRAKTKIKGFLEKVHGISFKQTKKQAIISRVEKIKEKLPKLPLKKKQNQILISGETGIKTRLSKCCNPKQGDKIQAFIAQGEAASVHKATCPNLKELSQKWPKRIVPANWQKQNDYIS